MAEAYFPEAVIGARGVSAVNITSQAIGFVIDPARDGKYYIFAEKLANICDDRGIHKRILNRIRDTSSGELRSLKGTQFNVIENGVKRRPRAILLAPRDTWFPSEGTLADD